MKIIFLTFMLVAAIGLASGLLGIGGGNKKVGFKATFGLFNNQLPRTVKEATRKKWVQVERDPNAIMPGLDLYCPKNDVTVCVLFLDVGYVAGLQIALPKNDFKDTVPSDLSEIGFRTWTPEIGYYAGEEHWYTHQFFVSPTSMLKTEEDRQVLTSRNEILYDGGVYLPAYDGETLEYISADGSEMKNTPPYTKQACIPAMGTHYYYNMTSSTDCGNLYPWFTLVDGKQLVGTGFMVFGKLPKTKRGQTTWFEQPNALAVKSIVTNGPKCLPNLARNPGVTTMHIYYIDRPASVGCLPIIG